MTDRTPQSGTREASARVKQMPLLILITTIAGAAVAPALAAADLDKTVDFHIPAQPLDSALLEFSRQARVQVAVNSRSVGKISAPTVDGPLAVSAALSELLRHSGLEYATVGNTVTVSPAQAMSKSEELGAPVAPATPNPSTHITRAVGSSDSSTDAGSRDPGEAMRQSEGMSEVIVTATKRPERLLDTPQSVTVLSGDSLAELGANKLVDFANTVPGLSFETAAPGWTQISLRGVTVGFDASPTVGVYVDEVPYGSSTSFARSGQLALDAGLVDLDRVEVLRGPQGTLYGASTMGGLIKYVTKAPTPDRLSGDFRTSVSDTHDGGVNYNFAGVANIPLVSDKAALRASAFENHEGGYIDNIGTGQKDVNSSDVYGARLDLLVKPIDELTVRVNGFLQNTTTDGFPIADYSLNGVPKYDSLTESRLIPESFDQKFRLASATVTYDFGAADLTSISSYQTLRSQFLIDLSAVIVPALRAIKQPISVFGSAIDTTTDKYTQEVRLASRSPQTLEWTIGGFYDHETSKDHSEAVLRNLSGQPTVNNLQTFDGPSTFEEYAAFGDLTWHLTKKFDLTGGTRYARDSTTFAQTQSGLLAGGSATANTSNSHVFTYLANARYHFTDHATGYLRYATGYRPGGPNFLVKNPTTGLIAGPDTFDSDSLKSYEVGIKADTADRKYGIDLSTYYIDWNNIQATQSVSGFSFRVNLPGGATSKGTELSLVARPTSAFTASTSFAYQDAYINDASTALKATAGQSLPNVPHFTASLNADYRLQQFDYQPTFGTTVRYVDHRTAILNTFAPPFYELPPYTMVDLRAGIMVHSVGVQFYARNVFDVRAQTAPRLSGITPAGGPFGVSVLQPRTIGMTLSLRF
jgi:outer membrane receptor protein involved in Fe transport